jgi:hypothetical protein
LCEIPSETPLNQYTLLKNEGQEDKQILFRSGEEWEVNRKGEVFCIGV